MLGGRESWECFFKKNRNNEVRLRPECPLKRPKGRKKGKDVPNSEIGSGPNKEVDDPNVITI